MSMYNVHQLQNWRTLVEECNRKKRFPLFIAWSSHCQCPPRWPPSSSAWGRGRARPSWRWRASTWRRWPPRWWPRTPAPSYRGWRWWRSTRTSARVRQLVPANAILMLILMPCSGSVCGDTGAEMSEPLVWWHHAPPPPPPQGEDSSHSSSQHHLDQLKRVILDHVVSGGGAGDGGDGKKE